MGHAAAFIELSEATLNLIELPALGIDKVAMASAARNDLERLPHRTAIPVRGTDLDARVPSHAHAVVNCAVHLHEFCR